MKRLLLIILIIFLGISVFLFSKTRPQNQDVNPSNYLSESAAKKTIPEKLFPRNPVDSQASETTKKILKHFYDLSLNQKSNKFIIGQNIGAADKINLGSGDPVIGKKKFFDSLEVETGKSPAYVGVGYTSGWTIDLNKIKETNKLLVDEWSKGGLVEISLTPQNPWTGKSLKDFGTGKFDYDSLFMSGSESNKRWNGYLDDFAKGLDELQKEGVTVLWRPLAEMNGHWFWWSYNKTGRASPDEYTKLWKYTFNYLTLKKGLHNLLWIYAPNSSAGNNKIKPADYYYPGDDYVDIVALDYYSNNLAGLNSSGDYDAMVKTGKPMGLAEVGPADGTRASFNNLTLLKVINEKYPNLIFAMYWNSWNTFFNILETKNPIIKGTHAKEFMNSDMVLTRDKIKI